MIKEFKLNTTPTQFDLEKIEKWLIEENKKFNEGFYCNWTIIEKAFKNNELVTLDFKERPIGFLVWSKSEIYAEIDILEIKPEHRKKELDNIFLRKFRSILNKKDF